MTPFTEDSAVLLLARDMGLSVDRRHGVEISDPKAIKAAGLVRETPDYTRIRKLLEDGVPVAGASLAGVEYVIRRKQGVLPL